MFQTEYDFILPCGYLNLQDNTLHREGIMRRATAIDEIAPQKDPRVVKNPAYLVVILLSKVITRLGTLPRIDATVIEGLYTTDLAYLQKLYNQINQLEEDGAVVVCPQCQHTFHLEANDVTGGS